jgi:hypothetical protein
MSIVASTLGTSTSFIASDLSWAGGKAGGGKAGGGKALDCAEKDAGGTPLDGFLGGKEETVVGKELADWGGGKALVGKVGLVLGVGKEPPVGGLGVYVGPL